MKIEKKLTLYSTSSFVPALYRQLPAKRGAEVVEGSYLACISSSPLHIRPVVKFFSARPAQGEHIDPTQFYEVSAAGQVSGKKQLNLTAEYPDAFLKAAS